MDSKSNERIDDQPVSETPEDVAILYSWANLHGAKYRDFSASRREYRAQLRHRAAEAAREQELKAQAEAEAAAAEAERVAREAEEAAHNHFAEQDALAREEAQRLAEEAARKAAAERVEATRRAEAAAAAEAAARREEQEMAQAHESAKRQAARYAESEIRRRDLAGPQPFSSVPGQISDPYTPPPAGEPDSDSALDQLQLTRYRQPRERNDLSILPDMPPPAPRIEEKRRPQGFRPDEPSGYRESYRPEPVAPPINYRTAPRQEPAPELAQEPRREYRPEPPREYRSEGRPEPVRPEPVRLEPIRQEQPRQPEYRPEPVRQEYRVEPAPEPIAQPAPRAYSDNPVGPAWLYAPQTPAPAPPPQRARTAAAPVADTLQHSRERVASRWFALKGVFDQPSSGDQNETAAARQQKEARVPMVAVFSLAGGVGKTSLVATLGRTLSSLGERVILTDTTSHGLLPFYFGASELRPGIVRTFSPPAGSMDAPISLVSYDIDHAADQAGQDRLVEDFVTNSRGSNRTVLDLTGTSGWVIRRLSRMSPTVVIPVAPDMNSVISLQSVEKFFSTILDAEGRAIQPYYLLNQFDASLPLHLDVREVLRRQLGDRLLPFVIRRSPAVSEALAEGMTVVDYAPDTPIAEDYLNVANWVRKVSAPASAGFRNVRWSER